MPLYKLSHSLDLPRQKNGFPAFGIRVMFSEGAFANHHYAPGNANSLWALIGAAACLEDTLFFEVEREDAGLKFQGYGSQKKFCLFQQLDGPTIRILGSPVFDFDDLDLVQIQDPRWELIYFLPKAAFYNFEKMVMLGTQSLQSGILGEHADLPQTFAELGLPEGYC